MSVTVVVGGQYGSEAKGKAVVAAAQKCKLDRIMGIRCGGPNAGHVVYLNGNRYVLRMVPALVAVPTAELMIAPGAMVNMELLKKEIADIESFGVEVHGRLWIDPSVVRVDQALVGIEIDGGMSDWIGSTQTGTGATMAARAMRTATSMRELLREHNQADWWIREFIKNTSAMVESRIASGWKVFVEGTQGFGLSLYHSGHYPYCTSRDTTAAAFLSEAGISPHDTAAIIMVIRTYPIRVGGNSGPMFKEISWDVIRGRCGADQILTEMTSVTKKVRRVGEFDWDLLNRATAVNKPSQIVIHGMDYIDWADRGVKSVSNLSSKSMDFIDSIARSTRVPVTMAFTGPLQEDVVYDVRGIRP